MNRQPGSTLRLHLIRHGETAWSLSGRHTGRTDLALTPHGEAEARELGRRLRGIPSVRVFSSPLARARQTCALSVGGATPEILPDLVEWDYGDYEGIRSLEIIRGRPGWNLFRDGCPGGETPEQVGRRADRVLGRFRALTGNIVLFTHGHFSRVLGARWIGLEVAQARHFLLGPASCSVLAYEHGRTEEPVIAQWNHSSRALPRAAAPECAEPRAIRQPAIERWENEGGEIPIVGRRETSRPRS